MSDAASRLSAFRFVLQRESLHAYIIPTEDAHQVAELIMFCGAGF
jgi:hypothetical protein